MLRNFALFVRFWPLSWSALLILLNAGLIVRAAQPSTDSAIFLYVGQQIARGGAPYRDVFDHKGPLIYWINAIPFWLGLDSLRAIAVLETLGLVASVIMLGQVLHRAWGARAAWIGFFSFCGSLTWGLTSGNYTEEWALMLGCLAIWAALTLQRDACAGATVGLCTAGALLLRPNEAIFGFVLWLVICRLQPERARVFSLAFVAALLTTLAIAAFVLLQQNALSGAFQQYLLYNLSYMNASWATRLQSLLHSLSKLAQFGGLLLALWGVITLWPGRVELKGTARVLFWFSVWALPLQLLSAGFSGRGYSHYFLAIVLPIAILCASVARSWQPRHWRATPVLSVLCAVTIIWGTVQIVRGPIRMIWRPNVTTQAVVMAIETHSQPDQKIVVWGNTVSYLLLSKRQSATRAVYQTPIFNPNYALGATYRNEFFAQIEAEKPIVVVDAELRVDDFIPSDEVPQLRDLLQNNYHAVTRLPDKNGGFSTVWVRNSPPP